MSGKGTRLRNRMLTLAVAAVGVVAIAGTALAGHQPSGVKSYTGCLVSGDGVVIKIREGNAPRSACTGGQVEAHFSGGDITEISVGNGLVSTPNPDENGAVRIELAAGQVLPQGCDSFEFPIKRSTGWSCADHTVGPGLVLGKSVPASGPVAVKYELATNYRVKNDPDCPSGEFATGFDGDGDILCDPLPASTLQASSGPQASFSTGVAIPDDGDFHVMASVTVPTGNYLVTAKGQITSSGNVDSFSATECQIQSGAVVYDSMRWGSVTIDDNPATTLALAGLGASGGATIDLACAADDGADGVGLKYGRLVVLKVG